MRERGDLGRALEGRVPEGGRDGGAVLADSGRVRSAEGARVDAALCPDAGRSGSGLGRTRGDATLAAYASMKSTRNYGLGTKLRTRYSVGSYKLRTNFWQTLEGTSSVVSEPI